MSAFLELTNIHKTYGQGVNAVHALNGVNLTIEKGDMVAVMGASGSGKSTLLNIVGLLDDATSGDYAINGAKASALNHKKKAGIRNSFFGFVVQDFALIEKLTVSQNIAIPFAYREQKLPAEQRHKVVSAMLQKLGIGDKGGARAQDLSGGQRQRVAIARALINNPDVILADEPTGALDTKTSQEIMKLFKKLNAEGKTIIMITHNESVADYCDRKVIISDGVLS